MMRNWYYDHDSANNKLHVYNTNKNEIASSPKTLDTDGLDVPEDVLSVVGDEIKAEINDSQASGGAELTSRAMEIMAVMMLPDRNIQPL